MMGAQQRRETVQQLHTRGLSLRRSCALCHISRSSLRYQPRGLRRVQNQHLVERLHQIARKHPRYGYRRAHALVARDVAGINVKRVHQLWRHEHLSVPCRRPRKRKADRTVPRPIQATCPNQVWTYDFMQDACANGQRLKLLTITDEFTRESVTIEVATRISARRVTEVLAQVMHARGTPAYLRSDNGPEFVAQVVRGWLHAHQVQTVYIDPGSPWQNAYGESFNGRFRDECLNVEWFRTVAAAQVVIETWRRQYNDERPHSSLGYQTPLQFRLAYEQQHGDQRGQPEHRCVQTQQAVLTV